MCIRDSGWIGIDPTNNCLVSDRHVRLAVGKDFHDCTPVKGIYKGNLEHRLEVTVVVENTDSHISVSYTHLDVYKRQILLLLN